MIRIMIVDDSSTARGIWLKFLSAEPGFKVVTAAADGQQAIDALGRHEVDVVVLDLEMPRMDGLTALPLLLARRPGVRVIVASTLTSAGSRQAVQSLTLGATDFVEKRFPDAGPALIRKIRGLFTAEGRGERPTRDASLAILPARDLAGFRPELIAIGTSTGGPNALSALLPPLTRATRLPILIVQHMPPAFTALLAERLALLTGRACREAKDGDIVEAGSIRVAPGSKHMTVARAGDQGALVLRLNDDPPEHFCRPAVDPLFRSLAAEAGPRVLALILTGMGEDGCAGARAIVGKGGAVIAQDEASSVVWGMPGAVARAGIASAVLPLDRIAPFIEDLLAAGAPLRESVV